MANQWIERWQQGNTGWHELEGNAPLKQHWRGTGKHVLVPFCGKSRDLLWLEEQGNKVAGVELSELAIAAFFDENELEYTVRDGVLKVFQAKTRQITIYCGDYFALVEIIADESAQHLKSECSDSHYWDDSCCGHVR